MSTTTDLKQAVVLKDRSSHLPVTDEELVLQYCATRDREIFAQLVQRYEGELFNYLRRYTGNSELAEDVFQATFLQVHLKCDRFEEGRRFRPWLYTIATNQAIDAQRRNKRHRMVSLDHQGNSESADAAKLADLLVGDDEDPLDRATRQEQAAWIQQAMESLSDQMRSVIHLVYYQGLKYREAAEVLSIPVGTVKSRLHAAINKLNQTWEESGPEHATHVKH